MVEGILMDLLVEDPYYGYLAGRVRFVKSEDEAMTYTSFDEGPVLHYNEDKLLKLSYAHQKGVIIHELLHLALLHFLRGEGKETVLWHMACDMAVSDLMEVNQLHDGLLTPLKLLIATGRMLPEKGTAETYYEFLKGNEDKVPYTYDAGKKTVTFKNGKTYNSGELEKMDQGDIHIQALIDELANTQIASLDEDALSQKTHELTEHVYKDYKINWRDVLKKFLAGQGRIQQRRSYKRPSRRYDHLPGMKRATGVRALVAVDESGSVSNQNVKAFQEELIRIKGIAHAEIMVSHFDTQCSEPVALNRFVTDMKRTKHGGTDFRPVFKMADRLKMPLLIIFTDGQGEAPAHSNQKVLWVLTDEGKKPTNYGKAIRFMVG